MTLSLRLRRMGGATSGVASAHTRYSERRGLLLGVMDGGRLLGLGEASPLPGFGNDDLEQTAAALAALKPPSSLPTTVEQVWSWAAEHDQLTPSARFAIETALLDALARAKEVSVAELLGTKPARVRRSCWVGHLDDADCLMRARDAKQRGATSLKLKATGRDLNADTARLRVLAGEPELRLDFNGLLEPEQVHHTLERYAASGVAWVEEPTSGPALLELGDTAIAWLVDESLCDENLCEPLIAAAAGVVLKPTVLGGMKRCLELAGAARALTKQVIVSHTFEGPVALAACCELALALNADSAGLDLHSGLTAFPDWTIPQLPHRAPPGQPLQVLPVGRPGLGLELCAWTA